MSLQLSPSGAAWIELPDGLIKCATQCETKSGMKCIAICVGKKDNVAAYVHIHVGGQKDDGSDYPDQIRLRSFDIVDLVKNILICSYPSEECEPI